MCNVQLSRLLRVINIYQTRCELSISREFSRWAHRRPVRIVGGEVHNNRTSIKLETEKNVLRTGKFTNSESDSVNVLESENVKSGSSDSSEEKYNFMKNLDENNEHNRPPTAISRKKKSEDYQSCIKKAKEDSMKAAASKLGVPVFRKVGRDDSELSKYLVDIKLQRKKSVRKYVLLEGKRLIRDAVEAGAIPKAVFFSHVEDIRDLSLPDEGVQLYKIAYKTLSLWSDVSTCPGVMGVVPIPEVDKCIPQTASIPLIIICDNIRDPGNMGTILRTAAAVGCEKVVLTKGCVDAWATKVLRAGAGAHFRVRIRADVSWNTIREEIENRSVFLADCSKKVEFYDEQALSDKIPIIPYYSFNFACTEQLVLMIGGETEGLSQDALQLGCEAQGIRLNIPVSNGVDSVNTGIALGVIAFEMKRQLSINLENKSGKKSELSAQNL